VKFSGIRLLACAVLTLLCVSDASTQSEPADLTHSEISLEERVPGCEGCPARRVTFRGAGAVEFECLGGCAVPGIQIIRFPREQFATLLAAIHSAGFFYLPRRVGRCFDCSIATVAYRDRRRIHEVVDLGFARIPALVEIQTRLRDAAKPLDVYARPTRANYAALLDAGWNPNDDLDDVGGTMLNYAVAGGKADAVELLLSRGAVVNRRALESAMSPESLDLLWTAAGVRPASEQARSLLWLATRNRWDRNVAWLIAKGVDVNSAQPEAGTTALMLAARFGHESTVDVLLSHKARTDLRDVKGSNLLWYAVEADHNSGLVSRVLALGLAVDAVNSDGRTALMHAAETCAAGNVRALLAAGADPDRRDKSGKTARDLLPRLRRADRERACDATRVALTR